MIYYAPSNSWNLQSQQKKLKTMLMQNFGGTTKSIVVFLKKAYLKSSIHAGNLQINPLNLKSDQHQISPCKINPL